MQLQEFIEKVNHYSSLHIPFLFLVDFEMEKPFVCRIDKAHRHGFTYFVKGKTNEETESIGKFRDCKMFIDPVTAEKYSEAFKLVQENILDGNTYLLNLTFPTDVQIDTTFEEIFKNAQAPYKLLHHDFLVFSPECFIKINGNDIYSYPMKGTIDANIPNAKEIILKDNKELWEHNTIVDLIRNDLSMVSTKVKVRRFRYISKIKTHKNELYQVNSEIKGQLPDNWRDHFGNILTKLLPAGSISGAPKKKTMEIIKETEGEKRGYYTGVFGIYDGNNVDSAVMIRFMENSTKGKQYRSGGGITAMSKVEEEYKELINKVYVPFI